MASATLAAQVPSAGRPQTVQHFPEGEDDKLLSLAGLPTVSHYGEVIRYTLRRGFGYKVRPSARIVQATWPYDGSPPQIVLIEFAERNGKLQIVGRREGLMYPARFNNLIANVAAAVSAPSDRTNRGTVVVCSHSDSSRLDLHLSSQSPLTLWRSATCSEDAPAVVAGELLTAAVGLSLELNRTPEPK